MEHTQKLIELAQQRHQTLTESGLSDSDIEAYCAMDDRLTYQAGIHLLRETHALNTY